MVLNLMVMLFCFVLMTFMVVLLCFVLMCMVMVLFKLLATILLIAYDDLQPAPRQVQRVVPY